MSDIEHPDYTTVFFDGDYYTASMMHWTDDTKRYRIHHEGRVTSEETEAVKQAQSWAEQLKIEYRK